MERLVEISGDVVNRPVDAVDIVEVRELRRGGHGDRTVVSSRNTKQVTTEPNAD
jgi:hypothetical protein